MKQYTPSEKLFFVEQVVKSGKRVSLVCRQAQISRKTFYFWLHIYKYSKKNRLAGFASRCPRSRNHWKSLDWQKENLVLRLVFKNPRLSCREIIKALPKVLEKPIISHHGVQNILAKHHLGRLEERLIFAKGTFWKRLSPNQRMQMVTLARDGQKISQVCRSFGISRKQFYKWRKRFEAKSESEKHLAFDDLFKKGEEHWRSIPREKTQAVLDLVGREPAWSVHQLHRQLADLVGHHGIQNILARHGLNTFEKRLLWVTTQPQPIPQVAPTMPVYSLKLKILRFLISPFTTIPKWVIAYPFVWPIAIPAFFLLAYIFQFDYLLHPQMFFPLVALTFGLFFFLYSLKYYLSLILILAFPSQDQEKSQVEQGKFTQVLTKIFGQRQNQHLGLRTDLDRIKLVRDPFVSIHLPFYNEKNVVERILVACLSMDYHRYEIVVADDSTDQTTEIIENFLKKQKGRLEVSTGAGGEEVTTLVPQKPALPKITLVHRKTRFGFKGGALQNALLHTDPRSEYILVFDADFIPYPDTIGQFLKYFQLTAENSRIAAVQGYQWHVLNKSENWITRGVRTEYAGSYVIERAGIEFYGGLKMIAGSVFCIRTDVLRQFGWGTSITEDFQLTLRLYEAGYKVLYTPYIQAPSECVSTVRRLIRQRMRWAEGHTFNVRKMWSRLFSSPNLSGREKFEFLYLGPYYLQATFFLVGTICWLLAEVVFHVRLPFWGAVWGWSLVFVNFLSLPLMNVVGLFLEQSEERDYLGVASFVLLSYILVPFQAYASTKALFAQTEGPWFRTPKTGRITDMIGRAALYRWFERLKIFPQPKVQTQPPLAHSFPFVNIRFNSRIEANEKLIGANERKGLIANQHLSFASAFNPLSGYQIKPKRIAWVGKSVIVIFLILAMSLNYLTFFTPGVRANGTTPALEQQINIIDQNVSATDWTTSYDTPENSLYSLAVDSTNGVLYAGSEISGIIYRCATSTACDAAGDWTTSYDTPALYILSLAVDSTNGVLYAGSQEDGIIYRRNANFDGRQYGSVCLSTGNYDGTVTYYFEVVAKVASGTGEAYLIFNAGDCTASGATPAGGSTVAITSITATSYTRYRSSSFSPSGTKMAYLSEMIGSGIAVQAARIIITQTDSVKITKTETQVELGSAENAGTSYAVLADPKIYCYGSTATSTSCTNNEATVWSPTPTRYFEAMLKASNSNTGQYSSIYCVSATDCKIAYYDSTNGDLRFVDCGDATCSVANATKTLVDGGTGCALTGCSTSADVGLYPDIDCSRGTSDCRISYYDETSDDLKYADCDDANCASGTINTIDSTGSVGSYSSIDLLSGTDVFISYYDGTNNTLKLVRGATNIWGTPLTLDGTGCVLTGCSTTSMVGTFNSLSQLGISTTVQIAYYDATNLALKFARCVYVGTSCTSGQVTTVDATSNVGYFTSMDCVSETDCKIAYEDTANIRLKFYDCDDNNCSTGTANFLDGVAGCTLTGCSSALVGPYTSIDCQTGATDCKITYYDASSGNLKFADCDNAQCGSGTATTVESTNVVGQFTGVDCVGGSTDCKISHYDNGNGDLRFFDCGNATCTAASGTATLVDRGTANVYAALYTTAGSVVSGSEISTSNTSFTLVRSSAITLSGGTQYQVEIKKDSTSVGTASIANAKIILEQSATGGITALETLQMYNNREISTQSDSYVNFKFDNLYNSANFTGSVSRYFESDLKTSSTGVSNTAWAKICDSSGETNCGGEISLPTTTTATRVRSTSFTPTDNRTYDTWIKCKVTDGAKTCAPASDNKIAYSDSASWLIIQITSLPVPEKALFFLPGIIFLPKIVEWLKRRKLAKVEVVSGRV